MLDIRSNCFVRNFISICLLSMRSSLLKRVIAFSYNPSPVYLHVKGCAKKLFQVSINLSMISCKIGTDCVGEGDALNYLTCNLIHTCE